MYTDIRTTSTEVLLRAVADPKRRAILEELRAVEEDLVTVERLTESFFSDVSRDHSGDQRRRAAIELRHTHLPKLAEANLIEYDRVHGTVSYRGTERTEALLTFIAKTLE
ncbi:DUF7344 domain-containing protein [Halorubrum tibetense]|uniref:DUF7344 domain-containing protein n=1 Tax=Halorubrum tibetense TaxID=175631 RepID=A0ABD5SBM0_9EURY